jgi:4-diphosphocytidyl-2-C-methyl-D-erythritol kinase
MVPISLYDRLELTFVPGSHADVRCRALQPGTPEDEHNLAGRAARLFMQRTGISGHISITIHKEIPIGAGLGGGSSDAAAVLRMLATGLASDLSPAQLAQWSLDLGADVPFFVFGYPAKVRGVGEVIEPTPPPLSAPIVVAFPGTGLSTAEVYRAFDNSLTRSADLSSGDALASDQGSFREILVNDLEAAAMHMFPPLRLLKMRMFELGACGALMTGSGSAMFGIWENGLATEAAETLRTTDGLWARPVEILARTPAVERQD